VKRSLRKSIKGENTGEGKPKLGRCKENNRSFKQSEDQKTNMQERRLNTFINPLCESSNLAHLVKHYLN
jgi:hypothetical protein